MDVRDPTWIASRSSSMHGDESQPKSSSTALFSTPPRSNPLYSSPAATVALSGPTTSVSSQTMPAPSPVRQQQRERNCDESTPNEPMHSVLSLKPAVTPAPTATGSVSQAARHSLMGDVRGSSPQSRGLAGHENCSERTGFYDDSGTPSLIPDRNSTLSAPPDLEISSRSLFAFKADYSGIFSDIRHDEHYESFYNNNPEKDKLPPPLGQSGLRRDDSDNSIEELIFKSSRGMRPDSSQNLQELVQRETSAEARAAASTATRNPRVLTAGSQKHVGERHPFSAPRSAGIIAPTPRNYGKRQSPVASEPLGAFSCEQEYRDQESCRNQEDHRVHGRRQEEATYMAAHAVATAAAAAAAAQFTSPMPHSSPPPRYHSPVSAGPSSRLPHDSVTQDPSWQFARLSLEEREPHSPEVLARSQQAAQYSSPPAVSHYPYAPAPPTFAATAASTATGHYGLAPEYEVPPPWSPLSPPTRNGSSAKRQPQYRHPRTYYGRQEPYPGAGGRADGPHFPYSTTKAGRNGGYPFGIDSGDDYMDNLNAQAAAAATAAAVAVYSGSRTNPYGIRPNRNMNRGANSHGLNGIAKGGNRGVEIDYATQFPSFNDIIKRTEELARDQHGCRFLQTKLEERNPDYINAIYNECFEKFVDLMTDPFGNYLCQKLFEFCNDEQRLALVKKCASSIPLVSANMHGTRAVQRMVECLSRPEQVRAVCNALAPAAVGLMKDINGNHVIQRCLHRMDYANNQFVYDAVANNCFELATHKNGCCVMQRCMDYASPAQKNQLAAQIIADALPLVQNAFGNYVVQYVLDMNQPSYTDRIIQQLKGHLANLSMQKFSSNVVEKCLQQADRETRVELINELIGDAESMRKLLHDAYGNYVIQRTLQIAESPQLEQICESIRPHLNSLKQSPYGKRIQSRILKRMPRGLS